MLGSLLTGELPRKTDGSIDMGRLIVALIQAGISFEVALRIINYVRRRLEA